MVNDIDERWNKVIAVLKDSPHLADRIVQLLYAARETLSDNEKPIMDNLINIIYPYTFFADACHNMFWMSLRGILKREHDPIGIASNDLFWPRRRLEPDSSPPNQEQTIVTELTAVRKELEHLKIMIALQNQKKHS